MHVEGPICVCTVQSTRSSCKSSKHAATGRLRDVFKSYAHIDAYLRVSDLGNAFCILITSHNQKLVSQVNNR
jgi:hypothetical protein